MTMKALDQLVARSIVDPGIAKRFQQGCIGAVLEDFDFSPELRQQLCELRAKTWVEFAVLAYRAVKAVETSPVRIQLPSPVDGLLPVRTKSTGEQVA